MDDTLTAHLDACAKEASAFTLEWDGKGWTAAGARKGGRKALTGSGETAVAAVAELLTLLRDEATPAE